MWKHKLLPLMIVLLVLWMTQTEGAAASQP
jgi:hypothetical protein